MNLSLASRGTVALVFLGAQALAQPTGPASGVQLSWARGEGAQGCPSALALEREVTERLGYSPFVGTPSQWIEGYVSVESGRYVVRLFERDSRGKTVGARSLSAERGDCGELGEATSLALALIVDPNASLKPLPSSTTTRDGDRARDPNSTTAATSAAPSRAAPSSAAPSTAATRATPSRADAGTERDNAPSKSDAATDGNHVPSRADAVQNQPAPVPVGSLLRRTDPRSRPETAASSATRPDGSDPSVHHDEPTHSSGIALLPGFRTGTFPELALGVEFAADGSLLRQIPIRYRLGMVFIPERTKAHGIAKVGYTLTAGHLSSCLMLLGSRAFRLLGGVGAELGAINTVVYDPDPSQPGDRLWLAARSDVAAQLRLWGPLRLEARGFVLVPITRWTFRAHIDGVAHVLYEQKSLEPGAVLGLGAQFP